MHTVPRPREYIPELDGLRAAGSVLVLVNHLWPKAILPWVWGAGKLAWIAMDSFFVMSGFLIAGILLDTRDRPDFYRAYYVRRTLRIFPLYYLVVGYLTVMALFWHGGEFRGQMAELWGSPLWFFAYLGNVKAAIQGAWPPHPGFVPLWSLQVEEQFYLLFPFVVRRLAPRRLELLLWSLVVLSPLLRIAIYFSIPDNPFPQYVLLPCHMEGLALGSLLAIKYRHGRWTMARAPLTVLVALLLAATCIASRLSNSAGINEEYSTPFNRTIGMLLSAIACTALVLWLVRYGGTGATRLLRSAPARYLGKISYGVYLLHVPVRELIYALRSRLSWSLSRESVPMFLIVVGASIACASISWFAFERPIMSLKDREKKSRHAFRARALGNKVPDSGR